MGNERRGDRRQPPRFSGGQGSRGEFRPNRGGRPAGPRHSPPARSGYRPRGSDEGGMAISVDPRRLSLLKQLAAEAGLRPGQLVQRWIEERLDAERTGTPPVSGPAGSERLERLEAAVAHLTGRLAAIESRTQAAPATGSASIPATPARRRGRPRKTATTPAPSRPVGTVGRVALHDEIIAVITERGPSTAAELAAAIVERGRYHPPRSSRPLDAATVNSRVSNPIYRARFSRAGHRIGLAADPDERAG